MTQKKLAIVLGGGGARGAYQVGILKSWLPIFKKKPRIHIFSGVSAGAINAVELVQNCEDLPKAVSRLYDLWTNLTPSEVFETQVRGLLKNIFNITRSSRNENKMPSDGMAHGLFNSAPLYQFLLRHVDMGKVHENLQKFPDSSLIINCFNYSAMKTVAFYQSASDIPGWERATRKGLGTTLTIQHILASCSVPFIFPTINLNGEYYGDGSLRNVTPLNPTIKMGADRIIGINLRGKSSDANQKKTPTLGTVAAAIFESMFMDSMDYDARILHRVNSLSAELNALSQDSPYARPIDLCHISANVQFGDIAENFRHRFPRSLRLLLGEWISAELLSYLLFDGQYAEALIEQGYKDGLKYMEQVEPWFMETLH